MASPDERLELLTELLHRAKNRVLRGVDFRAERSARKSTPRSTRFFARCRSSVRSSSRSSGDAMDHLDRDDLILLHYGEKASPGVREHLLGCEECRRESALLRRVLDAVDDAAGETPELAPAWEEQLWNRLRWKLERPRSPRLAWAAAAAAMLVIALVGGYQ